MSLEEVGWMVCILVGIAWWNINRAIRRWAEAIIGRLDKLEACIGRIDAHTAPDPKDLKDLGTILRGE